MAVRSRRSWTVRSTYQLSCPNCSDYKPAQNNNLQEDFQGLPSNITSNMPMILHCYVHTQRSYSSSTNLSKKNTGQRWKPSSRYPCNQHTGSKRTSLPSTFVTCTVLFFCRQLSSKQLFLKKKIKKSANVKQKSQVPFTCIKSTLKVFANCSLRCKQVISQPDSFCCFHGTPIVQDLYLCSCFFDCSQHNGQTKEQTHSDNSHSFKCKSRRKKTWSVISTKYTLARQIILRMIFFNVCNNHKMFKLLWSRRNTTTTQFAVCFQHAWDLQTRPRSSNMVWIMVDL